MYLFSVNHRWFMKNDLYEKALLAAWTSQKYTKGMGDQMKLFLALANRQKLMAHSDPYRRARPSPYTAAYRKAATPVASPGPLTSTWRGSSLFVYSTLLAFEGRSTADDQETDVYAYVGDTTGRQGEKELLLILPSGHLIEVLETREANVAS